MVVGLFVVVILLIGVYYIARGFIDGLRDNRR